MNETNRTVIILLAALWIVLMAVVIFVAWAADVETVERLDDFVQYLDDHRDNAGRLIVTLGALVLIVLSLLVIIVELAPEEETREIRVEQAGATTIVPAEPLRLRLEEALTTMPQVSAARARIFSQDKGIGLKLDLTVTPDANIAVVTQDASRVVVETLQADLGLPVAGTPSVRIIFGPPKEAPVASSITRPPTPQAGQPEAPTPEQPTPPPAESAAPDASEPPTEPAQETTAPEEMWPSEPPSPTSSLEEPTAAESPSEDETQQQ